MQWYRDLRGPPLYSGLGDRPNNLILFSFPSPEKVPLQVPLPPYRYEGVIRAEYDVAHRSNCVFFAFFTRVRGSPLRAYSRPGEDSGGTSLRAFHVAKAYPWQLDESYGLPGVFKKGRGP